MAEGQVFIVTGAGSGIGAATVQALTTAGHHVVAAGRREEPLRRIAEQTGALAVPGDAATQEGVAALVDAALTTHGRLEGLVLNAGVMIPGKVGDTRPEDWDETLRTNLTGPFLLAHAALPHLLAARGSIVAVSSVAGLRAPGAAAAYASSKAGLGMLIQCLAAEYGPAGLRANVVCPGWVRTEMADAEMDEYAALTGAPDREAGYAEVTGLVPARRPAEAEEIAEAVVWLLSGGPAYVNGAVLAIDGGASAVDVGTLPYDFRIEARP